MVSLQRCHDNIKSIDSFVNAFHKTEHERMDSQFQNSGKEGIPIMPVNFFLNGPCKFSEGFFLDLVIV